MTITHESAGLVDFAEAGKATAKLDIEGQGLFSWLKYEPANKDSSAQIPGKFRNLVQFGRYDYQWKDQTFIVYLYCKYPDHDPPTNFTYFVLRKREGDQIVDGKSSSVKDLVAAASSYADEVHDGDVWVWDDDSWTKS